MTDQILNSIIPTLFAIITTIIGAVLGFLLSEISTRRREQRTEKQQARSLRAILRIEMARNLTTLKQYWSEIQAQDSDSLSPNQRSSVLAERLVNTPLPAFSREALTSQLPLVALSLSPEDIEKMFQFYDRLATLATFRTDAAEALRDQQGEMTRFRQSQTAPGQTPGLVYAPRRPFDTLADQRWNGIEALIRQTLEAGNPLG